MNPKLRFKREDGTDYPDWEEITSDILFDNISEKGREDKIVLTVIQGVGTVPRNESGRNILFETSSLKNYKFAKKNDFIIHLRSFEGGLEIANSDGILSPAYRILRAKKEISHKFFYNYFHTIKFISFVLAKAVEGIRDGRQINYNVFKKLKFPFPCLEEQQKIANCLSSFDNLISIYNEQLKTLQDQKKGIMQKIFRQEVRFKKSDGTNYPDWEEKSFNDVFDCFEYGLNASATKYDGKNKYIRITDIDEESRTYSYNNVVSPNCELEDKYLVKENDILFARTGASVGKTYLYQKSDGILYFAGFLIRGNVNSKFDSKFIFQSTLSEEFKIWIKVNSIRTGQPGINSQQYASYKLKIPCLEEQQKIADCLFAFDEAIKIKKEQIKTAKDLKKGLLQQMFV